MSNNKSSYDYKNRNLSDVFKELQSMQNTSLDNSYQEHGQTPPLSNNIGFNYNTKNTKRIVNRSDDLKLSHIITGFSILVVSMGLFFPKSTSFSVSYAKEEPSKQISEYELNRHSLNIQNIISENVGMDRVKEQAVDEREVEFETTYTDTPSLPKGEEIITQEGILGKDKVTVVKTFENGAFVEEIILSKEVLEAPTPKLINLGTSEFLAKHKVHIGDTMYFVEDGTLRESADETSNIKAEVKKSIDVKLLELPSEEYAKVSFDSIEGYIKTSNLTSSYSTPSIVEKNRIQRLLLKVNINMDLNKSSGLTLNDYKKIFTGLPNDTNKIFESNYQVFYNMDKKYNINGIFLASMAIHESGWGTSQIAKDKKNLFGYGSYDSTPYESSFEFTDYSESIETVAKSLVKYYLNPTGTKIYDGELAAGTYFNGPSLSGVNTRYASDQEWHNKVYKYMEQLYNRL